VPMMMASKRCVMALSFVWLPTAAVSLW